ncbi:MAG: DUF3332 family protein [Leptospiraceae bacterium]|nr:DUF3332 family protein [Leptospiraceae bacterium]
MKLSKKILLGYLLVASLILGTANCFGKFALVRKIYGFNEEINWGGGLIGKVCRTLVFYVLAIFVYSIAGFIDFIFFNLLEFWTEKNLIGLNEFDKNGNFTKIQEKNGEKVILAYSEFGAKLKLTVVAGKNEESFIFLRNEPGKIFKEVEGSLVAVSMNERTIGESTIVKFSENGELKTSRILDSKKLREMNSKLAELY